MTAGPFITADQVRKMVETDLDADSLQILVDDAITQVEQRLGPTSGDDLEVGFYSDRLGHGWGGYPVGHHQPILFPDGAFGEITKVVEGPKQVLLSPNDWRVRYGGLGLERLETGDHKGRTWAFPVVVTHTPAQSELKNAKAVVVDLVKLALRYDGIRSQTLGDLGETLPEYETERTAILDRMIGPAFRVG